SVSCGWRRGSLTRQRLNKNQQSQNFLHVDLLTEPVLPHRSDTVRRALRLRYLDESQDQGPSDPRSVRTPPHPYSWPLPHSRYPACRDRNRSSNPPYYDFAQEPAVGSTSLPCDTPCCSA